MRLSRGKIQFTRPRQNGALGRTIGKRPDFDNKFFRYFSNIFSVFTQVVKDKAFTAIKNRNFCPAKQPFLPHSAPFPPGSDPKMRNPTGCSLRSRTPNPLYRQVNFDGVCHAPGTTRQGRPRLCRAVTFSQEIEFRLDRVSPSSHPSLAHHQEITAGQGGMRRLRWFPGNSPGRWSGFAEERR